MIKIKIEDNKFKIKGSFDMGYAGKYVNEDYSDTVIEILSDVSEVCDVDEGWEIIGKRLPVTASIEQRIQCLEDYFNEFEAKIQRNIKQVNDNFLINIFRGLEDTGYPFWEIDELTIQDAMPQVSEDELEKAVYQEHWSEMSGLETEYYDTPNDGSLKKSDVEAAIRRMYPMFDLDALLRGVTTEALCLGDGRISFQCSDDQDCEILCSAYDELDENLTFTDWHNF